MVLASEDVSGIVYEKQSLLLVESYRTPGKNNFKLYEHDF